MNKVFKRLSAFAVIILSVLLLVACDDVTDNDKVSEAMDNLKVEHILGDNESKDKITKDLDLKSKDGDVTISWESSNLDVITNDGLVTRPNDKDEEVTMKATFTLNEAKDSKDFKLKVLMEEQELDDYPLVEDRVNISDFLKEDEGYVATILGVVTSVAPYNSFSIEDDTGAVAFRIGGKNTDSIDFKVGDLIVASVKKNTFNGLIQAELEGDYEVIEGNFPNLDLVDLNEVGLNSDDLLKYQSRMAKAENLEVVEVKVDNFGTIDITVKLDDDTSILRWDNRITTVNTAYLLSLEEGDLINVNGVTIGWFHNPQLTIGNTEDVTGEGFEEAILKTDFLETVNSFKFDSLEIEEDVTLDLVEKIDDVNVSWDVLEGEDIIDLETGKVTLPEESQKLILEATFTLNDYEEVRTFEFNVVVFADGEKVVSILYDGDTTNMSDDNNAELVGLDPEIFEVLSTERQIAPKNLHVGLNTDGTIRLYGASSYESKNTLAVLIKEGYKITNVEFDFKAGSNNPQGAVIMLGDEKVTLTEDDFDQIKTYSDLSVDGFSIRIVQEGGSGNSQIHINEIKITYEEDEAESKFTPIPKFELTFKMNGGDEIDSYFFEEGDKIKLPNNAKKEGAEFVGWFKDEELEEEVDTDLLVTEDLTVYAKWDEKTDEDLLEEAYNALNIDTSDVFEDKTIELPNEGINDATITWDVLEGEDVIDLETGKITLPEESITLILEATITVGEATDTKTFEIEVIVVVEPDNLVEYHETFDTSTLGKSYGDATFTGVNDIEWIVTHSRDEDTYGIDGAGIMLRRGSDSSIKATFPNGVFSFNFDARKAFTGGTTRTLIVSINGEEEEVVLETDGGADDTIFNFEFLVEEEEETTIILKPKTQGNHQITIDNFVWKEYEEENGNGSDPVEDENKYETLDEMKEAFLTDLHTFSESSDDLTTFMHGEGKDEGFAGTWVDLIQDGNNILYGLNLRDEDASLPHFINQPEYNEKWLPLLDYIEEITVERNSEESFWGSPFTGVRRINLYFAGTTFTQEQLDGWPDVYKK